MDDFDATTRAFDDIDAAIELSVETGESVALPWSETAADILTDACDSSDEYESDDPHAPYHYIEYRGLDMDGYEWRVRLNR